MCVLYLPWTGVGSLLYYIKSGRIWRKGYIYIKMKIVLMSRFWINKKKSSSPTLKVKIVESQII